MIAENTAWTFKKQKEELRAKRTTRKLSPDESSLLDDLTREVQSVDDRVMSTTQN